MLQNKLKMKDIDLLSAYKKKKEPSKYTSIIKIAALPVTCAVVMLLVFGFLTFQNHSLQGKIDDANNEMKQIREKIANDPNLTKSNTLSSLQANTSRYQQLYKNMQSYPQLSQDSFDQLLIASGIDVSITSFSYVRESQVITLQIEAPAANDAEQFVRRIKATNTFSEVSYSGYSKVEKKRTTNTTTNQTPSSSSDEESSDLQKLINALNANKTTENATTVTVYTATILCVLK